MPTPEQIRQRVADADTSRSTRRAAAAQQVFELAQHRATVVEQLEGVERELGHVLAETAEIMDLDELAGFTGLKSADLTAWLAGHKPARGGRRKKTSAEPRAASTEPATDRHLDPTEPVAAP
ncbi:hypothetical protein [Actinokineospora terrae]|uniref:Uncharacterized protein n=1 Tax=Actinokineospora terrae TaxID=155974 RepID=A0A1H9T3L9_9PSEU|nr:hypothetical protein [Actinokineospora terrae]SER91835.1 hypothetical protein SAMN04487818_10659 [Actinokineospora terrae]